MPRDVVIAIMTPPIVGADHDKAATLLAKADLYEKTAAAIDPNSIEARVLNQRADEARQAVVSLGTPIVARAAGDVARAEIRQETYRDRETGYKAHRAQVNATAVNTESPRRTSSLEVVPEKKPAVTESATGWRPASRVIDNHAREKVAEQPLPPTIVKQVPEKGILGFLGFKREVMVNDLGQRAKVRDERTVSIASELKSGIAGKLVDGVRRIELSLSEANTALEMVRDQVLIEQERISVEISQSRVEIDNGRGGTSVFFSDIETMEMVRGIAEDRGISPSDILGTDWF